MEDFKPVQSKIITFFVIALTCGVYCDEWYNIC